MMGNGNCEAAEVSLTGTAHNGLVYLTLVWQMMAARSHGVVFTLMSCTLAVWKKQPWVHFLVLCGVWGKSFVVSDKFCRRRQGQSTEHFLLFCCVCFVGRKLAGHSGLLLADWSEGDVQTWLSEEGLAELVSIFKANNIDGPELSRLNKETVAELGIG